MSLEAFFDFITNPAINPLRQLLRDDEVILVSLATCALAIPGGLALVEKRWNVMRFLAINSILLLTAPYLLKDETGVPPAILFVAALYSWFLLSLNGYFIGNWLVERRDVLRDPDNRARLPVLGMVGCTALGFIATTVSYRLLMNHYRTSYGHLDPSFETTRLTLWFIDQLLVVAAAIGLLLRIWQYRRQASRQAARLI